MPPTTKPALIVLGKDRDALGLAENRLGNRLVLGAHDLAEDRGRVAHAPCFVGVLLRLGGRKSSAADQGTTAATNDVSCHVDNR